MHPLLRPVGTIERNHLRFDRPYGTEKGIVYFHPSDESLGYFQPTLRVESFADVTGRKLRRRHGPKGSPTSRVESFADVTGRELRRRHGPKASPTSRYITRY